MSRVSRQMVWTRSRFLELYPGVKTELSDLYPGKGFGIFKIIIDGKTVIHENGISNREALVILDAIEKTIQVCGKQINIL